MVSLSSPLSSLRSEVQAFVRACEHLLSIMCMADCKSLSEEEFRLVDYYASEMSKVVAMHLKA
jgi:hypothetical protein